MNGNEWELLSPGYFSDMFVWLFNGGPLAFLFIFILLFFGNVLLPLFVKFGKSRVKRQQDRPGDPTPNAQTQRQQPAKRLSFADAPPYIPSDRVSYIVFFGMSLLGGILYFLVHLAISLWPAWVLTTGEQLQWLAADDVRALAQFLYRWVLTGYALAVLSIALGLDYIARWMAIAQPNHVTTMPAIALEEPPALPSHTLPSPTINPPDIIAYLPLGKVTAALEKQVFHMKTSSKSNNIEKKEDDKLLWDPQRDICVSAQGWIEYDDQWARETQRLLRFGMEDDNWYVTFVPNPLLPTSVQYRKEGKGRWLILTEKVLLTYSRIDLKWKKDNVSYECECYRYVKI